MRFRRRWKLELVLLILSLASLFVLAEFLFKQSRATTHLSAQTELVEIRVEDPATAGVGVQRMRLRSPTLQTEPCVTGILLPFAGTRVRYERSGFGPFQMELLPADVGEKKSQIGTFRLLDQTDIDLRDRASLRHDAACSASKTGSPQKIAPVLLWPVMGEITVGSVKNNMDSHGISYPAALISGKLHVSAQSRAIPGMARYFYALADIDLPVGSSISAGPTTGSFQTFLQHAQPSVSWHGVLFQDDTKPGLSAELQTDAMKLRIDEPGEDPIDMEVSGASQLLYDPNLIELYKLAGLIVGIVFLLDRFEGNGKNSDSPANGSTSTTLLLSIGLGLCAAQRMQAQIVGVKNDFNENGQGWKFLDDDRHCKVLTAAHLVQLPDHTQFATTIEVIDPAQKKTVYGTSPRILSPQNDGLDVAIFSIPALDDPGLCGSGGLHGEDIADRIRSAEEVRVVYVERDVRSIFRAPATIHQRSMVNDKKDYLQTVGSVATVVLTGVDKFHGSLSGSAVLDSSGEFLGMMTNQLTEREGRMVTANLIRDLMNSRVGAARGAALVQSGTVPVALLSGSSGNLALGPGGLFAEGLQGWNLRPERNQISFMLSFPRATSIQTILMHYASADTVVRGISIDVNDSPHGIWTNLQYCKLAGNSEGDIRCAVLSATARFLRITLKVSGSSAVNLSDLRLK